MQLEEIVMQMNKNDSSNDDWRKAKRDLITDPHVYCVVVFFILAIILSFGGCHNPPDFAAPRVQSPITSNGSRAEHSSLPESPTQKGGY